MRLRALCSLTFVTVIGLAWMRLPFSAAQALPNTTQGKPKAESQDPQRPIRVEVGLVNLFASVRDKKKHLVADLKQEEFRISEDGQGQKIAFFSHETSLPITLGLLIDTSGSEAAMLGAEQAAASQFLGRVLRKNDLAMVMTFDLDVDLLSDFTSDHEQLERAIERARINAPSTPVTVQGPLPQGSKGTNLYDAVYLAAREKLSSEAGRKAMVILTDAEDNGSKMRLEDALEAAQRSDTVIHILLVYDPRFGSNEGVAKKLAEETGGRLIVVHNNPRKLEEAFEELSQELRSQYTLGYYPGNAARDGRFRKVKVETTRNDLRVLVRKGYYSPKN
jgi:VWFA-related protein